VLPAASTPSTVRIAIDARKLHDFGIGTYVRNLLRQLARMDGDTDYVLICQDADRALAADLGPNFRSVVARARPYSFREQLELPIEVRRARPDVFHEPHYVLPPLTPGRSVVTIHDCIHVMFPQYLPGRLAHAYARTFLWTATRRAARILTVSEASKRDIVRFFKVAPERIDVIYNAIDPRFGVAPPEEEVVRVRERYQLHDPFVLYAGNIKPHKNLERLIEAFHRLRRGRSGELKLLIIGDEISKYATLRRAVHRLKLHKHVRFFGFVPDQTLAVLYRLAAVFVFPSLYEGFGLPPLEAMASGTPVVTSNVSSLPEVVGDAALLIDPYDPDAIADAIRRILDEPRLRADLVARGLKRAGDFSWERSVRRIREIYAEVACA
jgi:glycosyltransferase involved in cell wall biosynthesis